MVNMTVVKGKDIVKYILKLSIIMIVLICISKSISNNSKVTANINNKIKAEKLIGCLDETIPGIRQINSQEESIQEKIETFDPLKLVVDTQLDMISSIKLKEEVVKVETVQNKEEQKNIEVEHAQTGLTTQIIENNVPNKFTNSCNTWIIVDFTFCFPLLHLFFT